VELDWTTFLLEIVNFLVLVWILKRFLYKPVLGVIEQRRRGIEETLAHAESVRSEAEALREQYGNRLAEWETERQQAREALAGEIEEARGRRMKALEAELARERERVMVVEERRRTEADHKAERTAMKQAAKFAARLLSATACAEVESRLVDLVVDELGRLPEERISALRAAWKKPPEEIRVASGFTLGEEARERLQASLAAVAGVSVPFSYEQDEELLAGLRIVVGAWVLSANLRDELAGFVEFAHDSR
jgi:F-type H+-transporting ATPase subunit b